ncbi:flagellar protein FhlB-like protein [Alcanivorax sp. S71-1-4]|jgi:flagellar biosynthesis protein|uniref:EscU/YscU/HrcU family type III secretion system export apparatus switch protein n=1 Tax=Alcanivorax sp. S71-1-4 TaxID=1177159 RepID=UPI00135AF0CD|nr:EscU/YscU/HrcU family type III secretion system export apparatus switch protein [Alcanivorax sp. S71-1-4]KAF0808641.1 flagellar protein FhlB-like protein [Alcanivorax sp. S71-1-4]
MSGDSASPPPRRSAVALGYGEQDSAPRVLASGYGPLAERIIDEARRHDIYVQSSPELVGLLMQVDMDEQIPAPLYLAVAELLNWVATVAQADDFSR